MNAMRAMRQNGRDEEVPSAARRRRRRIRMAKTEGARRRVFAGRTPPPQIKLRRRQAPPTLGEASNFNFTFQSRVPSHTGPEAAGSSSTSPFPSVSLQTPTDDIPFSLRDIDEANTDSEQPIFPTRPPLPTISPRPGSPFLFSPGRTPLESPSLATYHAPEELNAEAGPSTVSNGYFTRYDEGDYVDIDAEDEGYEEANMEERDDVEYESEGEIVDADMNIAEEEDVFAEEDMAVEHDRYFGLPEEENEERHQEQIRPLSDSDEDSEEEGHEGAIEHEHGDDGLFREEDEEEEEAMDGEGLFDDDDAQWEPQVIEADVAQMAQNAAGAGAAPAQGPNQDIDPALVPDINDDMDGNVEDDMEGAMEGKSGLSCITLFADECVAIGMRGPIYGVIQNVSVNKPTLVNWANNAFTN